MATLTFSYRSKKQKAFLEARFSFRITGHNLNPKSGKEMPYSFYTRSKIEVDKDFWDSFKKGVNFKDAKKVKKSKEVSDHIFNLRSHVIAQFEMVEDISLLDKKWFEKVVDQFYNPQKSNTQKQLPNNLISYIDYFLDYRKHEISPSLKKKYNTIKNKIKRFDPNLLVIDINESFLREFIDWSEKEQYSSGTTERDVRFIQTVLRHARSKRVEVNPEFELLKVKKKKIPKIFLSEEELSKIRDLEDLKPNLDTARDWLLISCYTGQRISDFMRFNTSMVRIEKNTPLLEFVQLKTGKDTVVPILPQVKKILEKRDGEFPQKLTETKYNKYIKTVCKKAGLTKKVKGRLSVDVSKPKEKTKMRNIDGTYEKFKLVTSHIGRRSFSTNFYGKLPTIYLINITNHATENQFLDYIGKGKKDIAFDAYAHFLKLNENNLELEPQTN